MITRREMLSLTGAVALTAVLPFDGFAQEKKSIKVVMHSGLRILDPVSTTAYITRAHGFLIYDTLFGMDDKFQIQPQMVDTHEVSEDKLTYSFTLRAGLKFHDGQPVTSADVVASLTRWGKRDSMGQKLFEYVAHVAEKDASSFEIVLTQPYGLVLESLGKIGSNVPFIMPKRIAETSATENITEAIGSGPFKFVASEFQPGLKVVYEKFEDYVPRPSGVTNWTSGPKIPKLDRIEWINIPDYQTAINALLQNEIDYIEQPPHDYYPLLEGSSGIAMQKLDELGNQNWLRINWLQPPLNNLKIRQAVLAALSAQDVVDAQIGNPDYYTVTGALFVANTPLATEVGATQIQPPNIEHAKELLKEGGYNGEPIVLMHPTDNALVGAITPVVAQALRSIGMTVDMQSMDWQTLVARRAKMDPVSEGGWHLFPTFFTNIDLLNPVSNPSVNTKGRNGGFLGWPEDAEIETMRDAFAKEPDRAKQKQIAEAIQARVYDQVVHIPLGQNTLKAAYRDTLSGLVKGPVTVFWNIEKQ